MPTESELLKDPHRQYKVQDSFIWADETGKFFVSPANTGDCGDMFDTYEEAIANIE